MVIALKSIRSNLEITSSIKKHLHQLKEISHENVNKFVGACLDPTELIIVTQYCPRGSLQVKPSPR